MATNITSNYATVTTDNEKNNAFRAIVNSLLGSWGSTDWTGGLSSANVVHGFIYNFAYYWTGKLVFTGLSGDISITLPFKANYTIINVYNNGTTTSLYLDNTDSFEVTSDGGLTVVTVEITRSKK